MIIKDLCGVGGYDVVYADPPWNYNFSRSDSRKIENHYQTMTTDDICEMQVPTAEGAVLYLWATAPKVPDALKVMRSWGFEYTTCAIWDKEIFGMGYWFRGQHELLLVGKKGKVSPPDSALRVSSVIRQRRGKHSQKPRCVRDNIEKWFPHSSRIELFARDLASGWDAWGGQLNADDPG